MPGNSFITSTSSIFLFFSIYIVIGGGVKMNVLPLFHKILYARPGSRNFMWRVLTACVIVLVSHGWMSSSLAVETQTQHASSTYQRACLSMRVLAQESKKKPLHKNVENLASMGWFEGFVVDEENRDIILVGRRTPKWQSLHLDDLVVNVRNVWNREAFPYCSLDPRPEDVRKLDQIDSRADGGNRDEPIERSFDRMKKAWGAQEVVVGGIPRNSHHAHVMINADYHMKKLSQGLVHLDGIRSCLDIAADRVKNHINTRGTIPPLGMSMSRFWFHIGEGEPLYYESNGIVWLDKCSVVVLTERQRSTADGSLYDTGGDDPIARTFARELSHRFHEAAYRVPEYAVLQNLFRLNALLRAMHMRNAAKQAKIDLSAWLNDYHYTNEHPMPSSLPGVANYRKLQGVYTKSGMPYEYIILHMTCGGVSMEMELDEQHFQDSGKEQLKQFRDVVLDSRPNSSALSWLLPSTYR